MKRIVGKVRLFSMVSHGEPALPEHAKENAIRMFQGFLLPITTELEVAMIMDQASRCGKK